MDRCCAGWCRDRGRRRPARWRPRNRAARWRRACAGWCAGPRRARRRPRRQSRYASHRARPAAAVRYPFPGPAGNGRHARSGRRAPGDRRPPGSACSRAWRRNWLAGLLPGSMPRWRCSARAAGRPARSGGAHTRRGAQRPWCAAACTARRRRRTLAPASRGPLPALRCAARTQGFRGISRRGSLAGARRPGSVPWPRGRAQTAAPPAGWNCRRG